MERKLDEMIAALPETRRTRIEARAQALMSRVDGFREEPKGRIGSCVIQQVTSDGCIGKRKQNIRNFRAY